MMQAKSPLVMWQFVVKAPIPQNWRGAKAYPMYETNYHCQYVVNVTVNTNTIGSTKPPNSKLSFPQPQLMNRVQGNERTHQQSNRCPCI
jgi:hypothetical protein